MTESDRADDEAEELVAEFRVSHPDFPLMETVETIPDLTVRSQFTPGTVASVPVKDFLVESSDFEAVEAAAADDPSVTDIRLVNERDQGRIYRVWFRPDTKLLSSELLELGVHIDSIDQVGEAWTFRIHTENESLMRRALEYCRTECPYFALDRLFTPVEGVGASSLELPPDQKETLVIAHEAGYFEIPRKTSTEELGEKLGISGSAVSERLRRGIDALISQTIRRGETGNW